MKKAKRRKWTALEELELDNLYNRLHLTYPELAKRFNCTIGEIRKKVKEMGILQ